MKNFTATLLVLMLLSSCGVGDLVDPTKSPSYFLNKGEIYYSPMGNWFELGYTKCDTDPNTFEVLAENFAKDKHSIFLGHTI